MEQPLFVSAQVKATAKHDATTEAARVIIDTEVRAREEKTARLRALREAAEN
jgi:hypothetical protein